MLDCNAIEGCPDITVLSGSIGWTAFAEFAEHAGCEDIAVLIDSDECIVWFDRNDHAVWST